VARAGVVAAGVVTTGVVTDGTVAVGAVTVGVVAVGVVTAGVVTVGSDNVAVATGVVTDTAGGAGVVGPTDVGRTGGRPSASAAPATAPLPASARKARRYEVWGRSAPGFFTVALLLVELVLRRQRRKGRFGYAPAQADRSAFILFPVGRGVGLLALALRLDHLKQRGAIRVPVTETGFAPLIQVSTGAEFSSGGRRTALGRVRQPRRGAER
jgi:hypothetical protein